MKKVFMLIACVAAIQQLTAQDFSKVQTLALMPNQAEPAKTEIDKIMNEPKAQAKPEGWLWKSKIYAAIYADDKLRAKYPGSEAVSDAAFEKYQTLDPSMKLLKDKNLQSIAGELYGTSFNQGVTSYNTKKWDS